MPAQDLNNLVGGIGNSIREALHSLDAYNLHSFMQHFDSAPGEAGQADTVQPKTIALPMPTPSGKHETRHVPVVALLNHSSLQLQEIRIKLRVTLSSQEENKPLMAEVAPLKPQAGDEDTQPNTAEIELYFKRGDPPEGVSRVLTEYHKQL